MSTPKTIAVALARAGGDVVSDGIVPAHAMPAVIVATLTLSLRRHCVLCASELK